jgi:hypothetical protein
MYFLRTTVKLSHTYYRSDSHTLVDHCATRGLSKLPLCSRRNNFPIATCQYACITRDTRNQPLALYAGNYRLFRRIQRVYSCNPIKSFSIDPRMFSAPITFTSAIMLYHLRLGDQTSPSSSHFFKYINLPRKVSQLVPRARHLAAFSSLLFGASKAPACRYISDHFPATTQLRLATYSSGVRSHLPDHQCMTAANWKVTDVSASNLLMKQLFCCL